MVSEIEKNELVEKASISVKGKIVYITVTLKDGKRQDAEGIAVKSLSGLTEDEKAFYDVSFAFTKNEDEAFPILGYKKSDATIISWSKVSGEE